MVKCPKCGTELKKDPDNLKWFCPKCQNYVLFQDETTKENEIERIKERRRKEKEIRENRKKALLAAGATAAVAGGAYAESRSQQPSLPQYPRRKSPLMKYLLLFIVLGAIGFGLYKYGPTIWGNIKSVLPSDFMSSSFMLYLNCIPKALSGLLSGDFESMTQCFSGIDKSQPETSSYEILAIESGNDEKKLDIPYGERKYSVPVEIRNLVPERPITVSVKGYLDYTEEVFIDEKNKITVPKRIDLLPSDSSVVIEDEYKTELRTNNELNCSVEEYEDVIIEVTYSDYSTSKTHDFIFAKSKEHLKIAKTNTPQKTSGPVYIDMDFSPNSYYPEENYDKVNIRFTFRNKVVNSKAKITGFELRKNDIDGILNLDECVCQNWGEKPLVFSKEKIDISQSPEAYTTLTNKAEHICICIYTINKEKVNALDAYKTLTFNATIYYDVTRTITRTDIPNADIITYCKLPPLVIKD